MRESAWQSIDPRKDNKKLFVVQEWKFSVIFFFPSLFNLLGKRERFNENWFILIIQDFMLLFTLLLLPRPHCYVASQLYLLTHKNVHGNNMQTLLALERRKKIFQLELYSFIIIFIFLPLVVLYYTHTKFLYIHTCIILTLLLEKSIISSVFVRERPPNICKINEKARIKVCWWSQEMWALGKFLINYKNLNCIWRYEMLLNAIKTSNLLEYFIILL